MRIPVEQQILAVVFSLILLLVTVQLVRKHRLREEYALVWLGASLVIFVLTVFDPLVGFLADLFAVSYAPTLIVVFGVLFCLSILLSQSVLISFQADRIRDLAQSVGLLEWRIHQLQRGSAPDTVAQGGTGTQNGTVPNGVQAIGEAAQGATAAGVSDGVAYRNGHAEADDPDHPDRPHPDDRGHAQPDR
ncbi:MAG: DUF2304 domain-containing protein [Litorilinea sp.]